MSSQLDVMGRFETFINEFTDELGVLRYREKIREMPLSGSRSLFISFNDLLHHDPRLAEEVLAYPEECLSEGTKILIKILQQSDPKYIEKHYQFHLRLEDLTDRVNLRTLKTEHLGILTSFEGIVIGVTDTKPLLIEGHFKCASCGESNQIVEFPEGIYSPPYQCRNDTCQRKGSLVLQIEFSRFIDWQKITIQEKPEELPPGQLPQSIMIHVLDDLVDKARPGDRVEVVGVLKARASRMLKRGQLATYSKFFNGVSIGKETAEYVDIEVTEEDLVVIRELAKSPYIIEKIRDSLAPSIYGHDLVKEAIATLLFGGTLKETPDGMKIRGESNILLIGDPGVGKCVHPESEIILASGERQRIKDLVESNITGKNIINDGYFEYYSSNLMGMDKNGKLAENTSNILWKRKSPRYLYSIKTLSGRRIRVTPTHPFFCCENGFIKSISAEYLTDDSFIAVPRRISAKGDNRISITYQKSKSNNPIRLKPPNSITPWFAEFLGLFIGEGYSQDRGKSKCIWFCNSDESLLIRFKSLLENFSVNYNQRLSSNKSAYGVYCASSELYKFLEALEPSIVKKSRDKRVPNQLLRGTDDIISIFLRALFDGEAHVDKSRPKIELASASYNLLSDVQTLLLRFGILSHIKDKIIEMGTYYRLNITGLPNIRKYHEKIGFSLDYKNQRLSEFLHSSKIHNTNVDIIPNVGGLIRKIRTNAGVYQSDFSITRSAINHYERKDRNPSRGYLKSIVEDFRKKGVNCSDTNLLERISSTDIYWDKVTEIRKIPSDTDWVYDLQVPDVHNYIANGFFVHNSQLLKFVTRLAPRALYTTGKGSTAAGLCVSGDSEVWLSSGSTPISIIVEKEFQKGDIEIYNDNMKFKRISNSKLQTYHSKNLKVNLQSIERVWKIKSPKNLFSISTRTGKKLKLTSETSLLTYNSGIGLVWKAAKYLKRKDTVATAIRISSENCLSKSNIFWDVITEVEFIKAEDEYVYDLTIPNTHNFIVNGFVTHNTAAVIRDQDTGEITLEAGALVLADQGIAMIDEFDKMRADDRTAIHEAMEQHTISIAKAGIVATLNARTSILAAANPKRGRWNPFKATAENLNLPPTILSRFDLIFVLEDKPNLKEDHEKASHILRLHKLNTLPVDPPIQQELLRKYIAHARREIRPKLSDDAVARLLEYYTELRSSSGKIEEGRPDPIAITPRQLEALVRLSEARAKMRLSEEVSYEDASGAVHLMNATLDKLARDETGKLDIDKYSSGLSDQGRRRLDRIDDLIDNMLKESEDGEPVAISAILAQALEDGLDRNQVEKAIEQRIRVGKLFAPQPGRIKKI
jgi:replicative DNA helicase Mcm